MPLNSNTVFRFSIAALCISFGLFCLWSGWYDGFIVHLAAEHPKAIIGLPCAASASLFLVLILKQNAGNIEFRGFSFEFKGASGEIVLWIFVFLSMAYSINALW